jgi:hypothetical protein
MRWARRMWLSLPPPPSLSPSLSPSFLSPSVPLPFSPPPHPRSLFSLILTVAKVIELMNTDLLRAEKAWADALGGLRTHLAVLREEGVPADAIQAWALHWDHQLYKGASERISTRT